MGEAKVRSVLWVLIEDVVAAGATNGMVSARKGLIPLQLVVTGLVAVRPGAVVMVTAAVSVAVIVAAAAALVPRAVAAAAAAALVPREVAAALVAEQACLPRSLARARAL